MLKLRQSIRSISKITPPSHFSSGKIPPSYDQIDLGHPSLINESMLGHNSSGTHAATTGSTINGSSGNGSSGNASSNNSNSSERPLRELTSLIAMFALGYIAVDNYINRIKLEKLNKDTTSINLKTLQIQQSKINEFKKKIDQAILLERRNSEKRNFKMSLHIALLRKQLEDHNIDAIKIDQALKEFETNVKLENSARNFSGQSLWLDESSDLRKYLPDVHDYDKKE